MKLDPHTLEVAAKVCEGLSETWFAARTQRGAMKYGVERDMGGRSCAKAIRALMTSDEGASTSGGYVLVPREPTNKIISAMASSEARDDECDFPSLSELIDFSGENETHTVLRAAYEAMIKAAEGE